MTWSVTVSTVVLRVCDWVNNWVTLATQSCWANLISGHVVRPAVGQWICSQPKAIAL